MNKAKNIKSAALEGFLWLVAKRFLLQIIITTSNLVLVRLLFPADFGTFAIIHFFIALIWVFTEAGLGPALVQKKIKPDTLDLRTVFWTQFLLGVGMVVFLFFCAPLFTSFYQGQLSSDTTFWLRVFAVAHLFLNTSSVSLNLLERNLRYKKILIAEGLSLGIAQAITIFLALRGFGVGSFVVGQLVGKFTGIFIFFALSPWNFGFGWDFKRLKKLLVFGWPYQAGSFMGNLHHAVVPFFVGRFPGPGVFNGAEAVGFLSWAGGAAALVAIVSGLIEHMIFPVLSRLQADKVMAQAVFTRALRVSVISLFGAGVVIITLASEITSIIYTPRWLPGVFALQLAVVLAVIMSVGNLTMAALLGLGESKFYRNMNGVWLVLRWVLSIPLVLQFGFWGVNLASIVAYLTVIFAIKKVQRYFRISFIEIIKAPFFAAILTATVLFSIKYVFVIDNIFALFLVVSLCAVFYFIIILVFVKQELIQDLSSIYQLMLSSIKRHRG